MRIGVRITCEVCKQYAIRNKYLHNYVEDSGKIIQINVFS